MFEAYFGKYLEDQGIITKEQYQEVVVASQNSRVKLGLLAVAEGFMTEDEAEEVNDAQHRLDKRFGDIAVSRGYLTDSQVEFLLKKQGDSYLLFLQAMVERNILTLDEIQEHVKAYKKAEKLSDLDVDAIKSGDVDKIIPVLLRDCVISPVIKDYIALSARNIGRFIERINLYAQRYPVPAPTLELDCKLNPAQLSVELVRGLSMLEPYGSGNPTPLFGLFHMTLRDIREIGSGKHLRLTLARGSCTVSAMRFSTTLAEFPYQVGDVVDLAITLDINFYNNTESLSVIIREMRFSDLDEDEMLRTKELFERFCRGDSLTASQAAELLPDREDFAVVYRFLRANNGYRKSFDSLLRRIGSGIGFGRLRVILESMNELRLIRISEGLIDFEVTLCEVQGKVDLNSSLIIQKLREVCE